MDGRSDENLVPFGKYKGMPAETLLTDRGYASWLLNQGWFAQRYPEIRTIIVNGGREISDTPDHNRFQADFINPDYLRSFIEYVCAPKETVLRCVRAAMRENGARLDEVAAAVSDAKASGRLSGRGLDFLNEQLYRLRSAASRLKQDEARIASAFDEIEVEPEVNGWDLKISPLCPVSFSVRSDGVPDKRRKDYSTSFYVELKPSVGDDFPSIIRQMKNNRDRVWLCGSSGCSGNSAFVLAYREYVGTGASEEEMARLFKLSGFDAYREADYLYPDAGFVENLSVEFDCPQRRGDA